MKKQLLPVVITLLFATEIFSQTNCSAPYIINICPDVYLSNQSTLAMLDDAPALINLTGEDIVYQINVPATTSNLYFTVVNATGPYRATLIKNSCTNTPYSVSNRTSGSSNFYFSYLSGSTYFFWIDAANPITFDLAIGADTVSIPINIPNTQGNLEFDQSGCASPFFNPAKPYFKVTYNGIAQTDPMMLAPLFAPGTMCISTFFRNLTGVEAISQFVFDFSLSGFTNIQCPDSLPGMYTSGYWIKSMSANTITYNFIDSLRTGIGDFDGSPNSCLDYRFCFNLVPLSNIPVYTNIVVTMNSDGKGAPYSGVVRQGCCPSTIPNCHGSGGGSGGGGHAFGFGVNDPGSTLPIELLNFDVLAHGDNIKIKWSTASEINNDFFSIEKSKDGISWVNLKNVAGAGNSSSTLNYEMNDDDPISGISYYRLKQTDYDGKFSYPATQSIMFENADQFTIYPNPASDHFTIENLNSEEYKAELYSNFGNKISVPIITEIAQTTVYTSQLKSGVYFVLLFRNNKLIGKKIITISNK